MRVTAVLAMVVVLCMGFGGNGLAEPRSRSILVMVQSDARGPFYNNVLSGLGSAVDDRSRRPVSLFVENLDLNRFSSERYDESLQSHLKVKYGDKPIGVIVALGAGALRYILRTRDALWPDVPVVFAMVDEATYRGAASPPDVTGSIMRLTMADMVQAARAVDPKLQSVAIVGDTLESQTAYRHFKSEMSSAAQGLELIDLIGMPMVALRERVAALPPHTSILYLPINSDGRGTFFPPSEAVAMLAEAANTPIIVGAESFFGRGATGGFVIIPREVGRRAGEIALRVLNGEDPASIPPRVDDVVKPVFDARQLDRWGVNVSALPEGSEIRYRPMTLWDDYRWQVMGIAAAFLVMAGLLGVLLHERHSRISAEVKASQRMSELAHINRHATAGEMSAAIAHELNQPLGAILNNAETAAILLSSHLPDVSQLKDIVNDIRRDDQRAGEIIRRLRSLVSKRAASFQEFDLNDVTREALAIADLQARAHGITLHSNLAVQRLSVSGDPIQLQQVILNLAINGIEAANDHPQAPRDIVTRTVIADGKNAEFSIYDFGNGIPTDKITHIFDPFFTTKQDGMGMGLSLARTIIEAHSGTIWAENATSGGAIFRFKVPLARHILG